MDKTANRRCHTKETICDTLLKVLVSFYARVTLNFTPERATGYVCEPVNVIMNKVLRKAMADFPLVRRLSLEIVSTTKFVG